MVYHLVLGVLEWWREQDKNFCKFLQIFLLKFIIGVLLVIFVILSFNFVMEWWLQVRDCEDFLGAGWCGNAPESPLDRWRT